MSPFSTQADVHLFILSNEGAVKGVCLAPSSRTYRDSHALVFRVENPLFFLGQLVRIRRGCRNVFRLTVFALNILQTAWLRLFACPLLGIDTPEAASMFRPTSSEGLASSLETLELTKYKVKGN